MKERWASVRWDIAREASLKDEDCWLHFQDVAEKEAAGALHCSQSHDGVLKLRSFEKGCLLD